MTKASVMKELMNRALGFLIKTEKTRESKINNLLFKGGTDKKINH